MSEEINLKSATDDRSVILTKNDMRYFSNMIYSEIIEFFKNPIDGKLDERIERIFATDYFFSLNGFDIDGEIKEYIDLCYRFHKFVDKIFEYMCEINIESVSFNKVDLVYEFN